MLHIYHGNGKGKTTAAVGLAVRFAGSGGKVLFMQFLKNGSSSEISVLKAIDGISVSCCEECCKFTFQMNENEKNAVIKKHDLMLEEAVSMIENGEVGLVILDEFLDAYNKKMLNTKLADKLILSVSDKAEVAVTGRSPNQEFIEKADYISCISAEKHPYTNGISARKGIEY